LEVACMEKWELVLIFIKVEVCEAAPASKAQCKKGKQQKTKENFMPVTLQNCLQGLECQQSQQGPLEELHGEQDAGQVHDLETKILSKVDCVLMCINASLQLEALKHKGKPWVQPH
ncbi:Surfeit locus protein 6, partial [Sciurus carolinensis]|nr:Surfeit locus protein 6 [Sciurus carolinensis]